MRVREPKGPLWFILPLDQHPELRRLEFTDMMILATGVRSTFSSKTVVYGSMGESEDRGLALTRRSLSIHSVVHG